MNYKQRTKLTEDLINSGMSYEQTEMLVSAMAYDNIVYLVDMVSLEILERAEELNEVDRSLIVKLLNLVLERIK